MSEVRILRLENAMATLAEVSAQHDERLAAIEGMNRRLERTTQSMERSVQTLTESVQTLTELAAAQNALTADTQRRVMRLEESYVMVVELLRSHHDGTAELRAAQANADSKLAALADAQIHTEARMSRLAESQAHSDRKLDALIDIVRGSRTGESDG